jgi:predicted DNA-binding transcriptional regulator AlpA
MEKKALKEKEAAEYIGMSRSFLRQDRMNGYRDGRKRGPDFVKAGRTIRYWKEDLENWLLQHLVQRTT